MLRALGRGTDYSVVWVLTVDGFRAQNDVPVRHAVNHIIVKPLDIHIEMRGNTLFDLRVIHRWAQPQIILAQIIRPSLKSEMNHRELSPSFRVLNPMTEPFPTKLQRVENVFADFAQENQ
jgi:hypothetical protein